MPSSRLNQSTQALGLGSGNIQAERREAVVPPSLIVDFRIDGFFSFHDQTIHKHALN
jgi:hypothetical protein